MQDWNENSVVVMCGRNRCLRKNSHPSAQTYLNPGFRIVCVNAVCYYSYFQLLLLSFSLGIAHNILSGFPDNSRVGSIIARPLRLLRYFFDQLLVNLQETHGFDSSSRFFSSQPMRIYCRFMPICTVSAFLE